ncbi:MAG: hypothetical protein IPP72_21140 [Chitinophagaceae bacterium]|nr:hypothetical protein [Chitinophagaceae bacterium]
MKLNPFITVAAATIAFASCKKSATNTPAAVKVNFIFKFDSTQVRLNGIGSPVTVPAGHGAQSPRFNSMSAHYVELTPSAITPLGTGAVVYRAEEVNTGGSNAIDFSKAKFAGNNQPFLSIPLNQLTAGTYTYLRVSLAYQNYNVYVSIPGQNIDATVASFIGFNTYIGSYKIKDSTVTVNANKKQGYWAVEASVPGFGLVRSGQAPEGATTVPNPLFATSAVPAGSCVVTGAFTAPLIVTGNETSDINIQVSLSTNKSFEWTETDGNNQYNPLPPNNDQVIDMGIRGMIPSKL